jgi:hypothetical protein
MAQEVEILFIECKALSSNPSTAINKTLDKNKENE